MIGKTISLGWTIAMVKVCKDLMVLDMVWKDLELIGPDQSFTV